MTAGTRSPASAVGELGVMGVVGTSAVLTTPTDATTFEARGKSVMHARRAFGGGDGGAKANAARVAALLSAREMSAAASRAQRLLDYAPGSSTPDGTGRAVGSSATSPLTSPKPGKETRRSRGDSDPASLSRPTSGSSNERIALTETSTSETETIPAVRRATPPSPPRSPNSPLKLTTSPSKSQKATSKAAARVSAERAVSPNVALAATAAAARVRAAIAASRAAIPCDPDPQASAQAREARAKAAAAAAAARVRTSRDSSSEHPGAAVRRTLSLAGAASSILEETRRLSLEAAALQAARRVQRAREREEGIRAAREAAESEKREKGRASRESVLFAKERRRREIYALNALLAASERAAANGAVPAGTRGVPEYLRV